MLEFAAWKRSLVLGLCLVGLLFASPNLLPEDLRRALPAWLPADVVNLGLDLQGGAHFLVEVQVEEVYRERMEGLVDEARRALRQGGVRRFTGLRAATDSARVRITRSEDVELAGELLRDLATPLVETLVSGGGPDIEIRLVDGQVYEMVLTKAAKAQIARSTLEQSLEVIRRRVDELGTREPTIQAQGQRRILVQLPGADSVNPDIIGKTAKLTFHLVDESRSQAEIADGRIGTGRIALPDAERPGYLYAVERRAIVTGEQLKDAQPGFDSRSSEPIVSFRFDSRGGKRFADVTKKNVGRPFAIVLDGEVISAPVIREAILGGSGQISGNFSVLETQELSALLRAGALPASITIEESSQVGPELGADSVAAGRIACLIALAAVLVFMVLAYGLFGLFADLALLDQCRDDFRGAVRAGGGTDATGDCRHRADHRHGGGRQCAGLRAHPRGAAGRAGTGAGDRDRLRAGPDGDHRCQCHHVHCRGDPVRDGLRSGQGVCHHARHRHRHLGLHGLHGHPALYRAVVCRPAPEDDPALGSAGCA